MSDEIAIGWTQSICPECAAVIAAVKVARKEDVILRKTCAVHGIFETVIWRGEPRYELWNRPKIASHPNNPSTAVERGCPWDCGLCPDHRQQTCTALLEITQRCNLECAFCFADAGKHVSVDPDLNTIAGWFQQLLERGALSTFSSQVENPRFGMICRRSFSWAVLGDLASSKSTPMGCGWGKILTM